MKLSIIIVNYNVKFYLEQCLLSVEKAIHGIDAEVVVVDNHSKDGSVEHIEQRFPMVRCISSLHNLGFARANNLAIKQTTGEYVLLLNPDTFVAETTIKEALDFMEQHPKSGGVGVRMLEASGKAAMESRRGFPSPMVAFYKIIGLCKRYPQHKKFGHYYMSTMSWDEPGKMEVISGAFCLLRRKVLDEIGLLDETFFMYGEDIDLSYRILKGGFENWYLPINILHYKGESTQKNSFKYVHVFYDAMLIFIKKHYESMSFLLSIPIKIAIYLKATLSLISMFCEKSERALGLFHPAKRIDRNFIFIGNEKNIERCKQIANRRGLQATFVIGNKNNLPKGHHDHIDLIDSDRINYIVYDIDAYNYSEVLELFAQKPIKNVFIGTYNKRANCIITSEEILE